MAKQEDSYSKAFAKEFVGGTVVVVGHPFDTLKYVHQMQFSLARVRLQTNPQYTSAMDCARKTVQQEGSTALYKGVTSPLMGVGFCNAVVFAANGFFRRMVKRPEQTYSDLSIAQIYAAGSLTGLVVAFINCPFELLKVRLQTQYSGPGGALKYNGVVDCGVKLAKEGGFASLFRGIGITLIRDVPSFGAYFATYEAVKRYLQHGDTQALSVGSTLLAGGVAGFGAWIPAYMQDVVKSRYQADPSYSSWVKVAKDLYAQNGFKAFWRGIGPTLLRAFPANAVTFVAYNWTMGALDRL